MTKLSELENIFLKTTNHSKHNIGLNQNNWNLLESDFEKQLLIIHNSEKKLSKACWFNAAATIIKTINLFYWHTVVLLNFFKWVKQDLIITTTGIWIKDSKAYLQFCFLWKEVLRETDKGENKKYLTLYNFCKIIISICCTLSP